MNDINAQIQEIKDVVLDLTSALEEQYGYEPGYLRGEEACTSFAEYPRLVREIPRMDPEINIQIEDLENRIIALEEIDHNLYQEGDIETFASSKNYTDEKFNSIKTDLSHLDEEIKNISINAESIDKKIDDKIIELDLSNTYDTKGSANSALTSAKAYTDQEINKLSFDASGSAASALSSAKTYADNLNTAMDTRVDALEASKDAYKAADSALEATLKTYVDNHVPDVPITVDSALSTTSTNPVQNKVIASAISSVQIKKESLIITETSDATIALYPNTIYDINLESRKTAIAIKLMGDRSDYHIMSLTFGGTVPPVTMYYDSGYGSIRWLDKYNVLNVLYRDTMCQITVFNNCASGGVFAYV